MIRNHFRVGLVLGLALCAVGCGKGPKLVPVTGTVKMDGKPLTDAIVIFNFTDYPRPAGGRTDSSGKFILAYSNRAGAPLGSCKVSVSKKGRAAEEEVNRELVPSRYNSNTQLQYEITKAGPNEFNLELDSTPDEADANRNRQPGAETEEPSDEDMEDEGSGGRKPPSSAPSQQNPEPADDDDDG